MELCCVFPLLTAYCAVGQFSHYWLPSRRTWHNSPVLDGRIHTKAQQFPIWVTAAVTAALAAWCAALTGTPASGGHVRIQERPLSAFHVVSAQVLGSGPAVLLNSTLAAGPPSASASSPPAAAHVLAVRRSRVRELLRYRALALLAIALTCLTALIVMRVRRRRAIAARPSLLRKLRRGSKHDPLEANAAAGRHAVAGPAGFGKPPTGRPEFTPLATMRRGVPDPAMGQSGPSTHRSGDPAVGESGSSSPSPGGPAIDRSPVGEADADSGAPVWDTLLPGTRQPWGSESRDNGMRKASAGPPWEPAEKPLGRLPWAVTGADRAGGHGVVPPRRLSRPGDVTDVPRSGPLDENHR